jgi:hypothetical protein
MNAGAWILGSRDLSCTSYRNLRLTTPLSCLSSIMLELCKWSSHVSRSLRADLSRGASGKKTTFFALIDGLRRAWHDPRKLIERSSDELTLKKVKRSESRKTFNFERISAYSKRPAIDQQFANFRPPARANKSSNFIQCKISYQGNVRLAVRYPYHMIIQSKRILLPCKSDPVPLQSCSRDGISNNRSHKSTRCKSHWCRAEALEWSGISVVSIMSASCEKHEGSWDGTWRDVPAFIDFDSYRFVPDGKVVHWISIIIPTVWGPKK